MSAAATEYDQPALEIVVDAEAPAPKVTKKRSAKAVAVAEARSKEIELDVARHERTPRQYLDTVKRRENTGEPEHVAHAAVEAVFDCWPFTFPGEECPSWVPGRFGKAVKVYFAQDHVDPEWIIRWAKNFPWLVKTYKRTYEAASCGIQPSVKKLAAAAFDAFDLMIRSSDTEKDREEEKTKLVLQALRVAAESGTPFVSTAFDDLVMRGRRRSRPGQAETFGGSMRSAVDRLAAMDAAEKGTR